MILATDEIERPVDEGRVREWAKEARRTGNTRLDTRRVSQKVCIAMVSEREQWKSSAKRQTSCLECKRLGNIMRLAILYDSRMNCEIDIWVGNISPR